MARISERNPRFRTKDEIAKDVAFILTAPVLYGTKYDVLSSVMWTWTEFEGKYRGCPLWSKQAVSQHNVDRKVKLIHEHVVPKRRVIQMLMTLKSPTALQVRTLLDQFLIGVVVTKGEDDILNQEFGKDMPEEFNDPKHPDCLNPWLRYKRHGIEVVESPFSNCRVREEELK